MRASLVSSLCPRNFGQLVDFQVEVFDDFIRISSYVVSKICKEPPDVLNQFENSDSKKIIYALGKIYLNEISHEHLALIHSTHVSQ